MTAAIATNAFPISRPQPIANSCLLNLLVISPDHSLRDVYREAGYALGYATSTADTTEQALYLIDSQTVDVILLDVKPPIVRGIETLRHIKARHPGIEVIVVSVCGTVGSAVQAMRAGACDYLRKPFSLSELKLILERSAADLRFKTDDRMRCERLKNDQGFGGIIGRTAEMEKLYRLVAKAAQSSHPVLILGESGTRKEMIARSIHYSGPWRDKPFIPVDCGSLVPTLIESELFGHTKGAFTGANHAKEGLLATGQGGTVFLDEIGELAVDLQAKLLRASGKRDSISGQHQVCASQRAHPGCYQPRFGAGGRAGFVPLGSLLSAKRAEPASSTASGTPSRYPIARGKVSRIVFTLLWS